MLLVYNSIKETELFTKQTITAGNFKFMFGEEYRPNTTASVTLYNGLNSASNASFSLPWTPPATEGRPLLSKNNQVVEDYVHEFVINGISEDESTETRLDPWWKNKNIFQIVKVLGILWILGLDHLTFV